MKLFSTNVSLLLQMWRPLSTLLRGLFRNFQTRSKRIFGRLRGPPKSLCHAGSAVRRSVSNSVRVRACALVHYPDLCSVSSSASSGRRVRSGTRSPAPSSVSEAPAGGSLSRRSAPCNRTGGESDTVLTLTPMEHGIIVVVMTTCSSDKYNQASFRIR